MILAINQPAYLPWLGYFHRIAMSDQFIVLDHVQFEKNSFINRNKVKTANGWCWLSVPVQTKGHFGQLALCDLLIDNHINWRRKHWQTIAQNYARAPFFSQYAPALEAFYLQEWQNLSVLCREMTLWFLDVLGINTPIFYSSELKHHGHKADLVLDLCRNKGADIYFSGAQGRDYLSIQAFIEANIQVQFQDYVHPQYAQQHGSEFLSSMGIIDLLLNCGPASEELICYGQTPLKLR